LPGLSQFAVNPRCHFHGAFHVIGLVGPGKELPSVHNDFIRIEYLVYFGIGCIGDLADIRAPVVEQKPPVCRRKIGGFLGVFAL